MSSDTPDRMFRSAGFTLLETLLSLAIAFVVVALVYTVYHSVIRTMEGQKDRQSGPELTAQVLQQISDDLARLFLPEGEEACPVLLSGRGEVPSAAAVSFCTLRRNEQESDFRWASVVHVDYASVPGIHGANLIRTEQPLAGPDALNPPVTNILLESIAAFSVEAWQEDRWVDVWPDGDGDGGEGPPRAFRLRLSMASEPDAEMETEVFIPVGQTYSGGLQRDVQPSLR